MQRWFVRMTMASALAVLAAPAQGQSCAGFTDVPSSSTFCPNVQWLKNRSITLGCTSPTLYCPGDAVSRLAMAAFMNRLGQALTPEILRKHGTRATTSVPTSPPFIAPECETPDSTITDYPRQVLINASMTGLADASAVAWRAILVYSTDGGLLWQQIEENLAPINTLRASGAPGAWSGIALTYALDLAANESYRFGIGLQRDDVVTGTIGNFAAVRCQVTATIFNRNGAVAPF